MIHLQSDLNDHDELIAIISSYQRSHTANINAGIGDFIKSLPDKFKRVGTLLSELSKSPKFSMTTILNMLKDNRVYTFLKNFDFSVANIIKQIKKALNFMDTLFNEIAKYIHQNFPMIKKFSDFTTAQLHELDKWLNKNPIIKRIGGVVLASLLLYVAVNGAFVGSASDFDLSSVMDALSGNLSFTDALGDHNGIKFLISMALGVSGVSISYGALSSIAQFAPSIMIWLAKQIHMKV